MVGIKNSGVKKRNLIIFFLCLAVFAMAIAYTVSGSILKINGVSAVTSRWDVRITNIKTAEVIGMARDQQEPTFSNFEASFSTLLSLPGDSMTYDVTVTNNGTLDAVIDDITLNTTNNPAIEFSISGIEKGDRLNAGASDVLKVKVLYKNKEALVGDNLVSSFSIVFNYIQASNYSSSKDTVCFDTTAVDDNSVTITNYYSENDGCGTSVKIPDFIDGKRVVAIDDKAFYSKNLIGVIIPSSVKTIGSNAFAKNEISLLELAEGLTNIAYGTFSDNKLTTVTIPSSVKSIGIRAFANNKINNLNFSKNLSNIDDMAFMNNNLVTIDLNTVQLIGAKAFANNKITSLVIPDSVMSLGEGAFANNVIESVNIGKQVKTLNKDVFISNKITSIVIPDNVTFLASSALENNPLENIALGTGIKEIKDNQFNGYSLKAITINGPITKIGDNAFYKNNLTDIVIPYTVT
ncbi:MAG: leucine-rich repeat domain-containing protein [Bacilli bacterium]|nr:leucine-rich repeat domain-containing protein [Bacilli bacterium]